MLGVSQLLGCELVKIYPECRLAADRRRPDIGDVSNIESICFPPVEKAGHFFFEGFLINEMLFSRFVKTDGVLGYAKH